MKNLLPIVLIVLVVGAGAYFFMKNKGGPAMQPSSNESAQVTPETTTSTPSEAQATTQTGTVKEVAVSGNEFAFVPKAVTVKKGDTVKLTFTNTGNYPHNWAVDELSLKTKTVPAGQSDTITFTADKAGTFSSYCSVDSHKDKGMTGTLIVQ